MYSLKGGLILATILFASDGQWDLVPGVFDKGALVWLQYQVSQSRSL